MGIVSGHRIIHNLMAGSLTGAQLETLLTTQANRASFIQAVGSRSQAKALAAVSAAMSAVTTSAIGREEFYANGTAVGRYLNRLAVANGGQTNAALESAVSIYDVIASTTAMNAVIASSTAMNAVIASSTAMNAVAASSTAMNAVAASSTAMNAVAASSTAKTACFNSDTALNAFAGSATALAALRAVGTYSVINKTAGSSAQTIPGPTAGQSYILLGVSSSNAGTNQTITALTTRRSGSTRPTVASTGAATAADAQTVTLCTPLVSPFTFDTNIINGFTWYFGLLRCDI